MKWKLYFYVACLLSTLSADTAHTQIRSDKWIGGPYDGLALSAGIPLPFNQSLLGQADLRLGNFRIGVGLGLTRKGEITATYREKFFFDSFYFEFGATPFGMLLSDRAGGCYSFAPQKHKTRLLNLAPLIGVGYQQTRLRGESTFVLGPGEDISSHYYSRVHYPYFHGGIEVFLWKFCFTGGYRFGTEIPIRPENIQLLNSNEQLWGFRTAGHWYARVGFIVNFL